MRFAPGERALVRATGCALALFLLTTPATALEFGDWDVDADGGLSRQEYRTGFSKSGMFEGWDVNDDDVLSREEFHQAEGDTESVQSFGARFGEHPIGQWDADNDNALSREELYDGSFLSLDADGNDVLDEPEFGDFNPR